MTLNLFTSSQHTFNVIILSTDRLKATGSIGILSNCKVHRKLANFLSTTATDDISIKVNAVLDLLSLVLITRAMFPIGGRFR